MSSKHYQIIINREDYFNNLASFLRMEGNRVCEFYKCSNVCQKDHRVYAYINKDGFILAISASENHRKSSECISSGNCADDVEAMFYLSKGFKMTGAELKREIHRRINFLCNFQTMANKVNIHTTD
ncbi:hypothetical protein KAR10_06355 [bacterium]|nr:hypothetical protein [bacterium]